MGSRARLPKPSPNARADQTPAALHVSSKEELYEELLYSVLNGWSGAFMFDNNSDDPKKVLSSYVRKKLDYALDNPGLSRIFTTEVLGGGRNLGKYWPVAVKSTQQKVDLINRWIAEGRMRAVDAKVLLMQIWGMTQHYADYGVQVHIMLGRRPTKPSTASTSCENSPLLCCWAAVSNQIEPPRTVPCAAGAFAQPLVTSRPKESPIKMA